MAPFMPRLLLYADAQGITTSLWRAGRTGPLRRFPNDASGRAAFREELGRHRSSPAFVIVESYDEDYAVQPAPRMPRRDLEAMLERRLGSLYGQCRYRGKARLPHGTTPERNPAYLFAALTGEHVLAPWMRILDETGSRLAGIYPLSVVLLDLLSRHAAPGDEQLLVVCHPHALRFLFARHGGLLVHRLTPMALASGDDGALAREIERTRDYLESSGRLGSRVLDCLLLDPSAARELRDLDSRVRLARLDASTAARSLGCAGSSVTAIALALLARRVPTLNLAPAELTLRYRARRRCRHLYLGTAATLLTALAVVAAGTRAVHALDTQRRGIEQAVNHRADESAAALAAEPVIAAENAAAAALVAHMTALSRDVRSPHSAYAIVAQTLDRHPGVLLEQIDWTSEDPPDPHREDARSPVETLRLHLAADRHAGSARERAPIDGFLEELRASAGVERVSLQRSIQASGDASGDEPGPGTIRYEVQIDVGIRR